MASSKFPQLGPNQSRTYQWTHTNKICKAAKRLYLSHCLKIHTKSLILLVVERELNPRCTDYDRVQEGFYVKSY